MSIAELVYVLSAATSLACAVLLLRGFLQSRVRLLLWSGLCFLGLAANNALIYVDLVIIPDVDLSVWRISAALVGMMLLLYGLIWDTE
ncbi:DUF5985 family protein [Thermithiobacillus tepidarius DSM 3134]|uniref:DUF5985 family protein n=1 Tax=Thermithiobacillus tepidarius TaxID=929 RepID=UPI000403BA18|nr:DUF5985 family protein [Thermithiobacillus tepidarius]